jgi:hypothetical protein
MNTTNTRVQNFSTTPATWHQDALDWKNGIGETFCSETWSGTLIPTEVPGNDPLGPGIIARTSPKIDPEVAPDMKKSLKDLLGRFLGCVNNQGWQIFKFKRTSEVDRAYALEEASWMVRITLDDTVPPRQTYITPQNTRAGFMIEIYRDHQWTADRPTFLDLFLLSSRQAKLKCSHALPYSPITHTAKCEFFQRKPGDQTMKEG